MPLFVDALRNDEFLKFLVDLTEMRSFLEELGINESTTLYPIAARNRIFQAKSEINKLPDNFHSIGLCLLAAIANKSEKHLINTLKNYFYQNTNSEDKKKIFNYSIKLEMNSNLKV